ncbi:hypothetical protein VTN77DRAFT_9702 [Rasamsonia byssochlamydoides]|uniref:uncharacterized protein n=1 Tax=Rasamsonia byssochlamydoides TaxID=89139 RepID=UPI00374267D5
MTVYAYVRDRYTRFLNIYKKPNAEGISKRVSVKLVGMVRSEIAAIFADCGANVMYSPLDLMDCGQRRLPYSLRGCSRRYLNHHL